MESVTSNLIEAANLMLVGMGFVFAFLGLLIVGVHGIAKFCQRFPGEEPQAPKKRSVKPSVITQAGVDQKVVAAISAAVHQHRQANQ